LAEAAQRVGIPYRLDPPPDGENNLDCSLYVVVTFRGGGIPFPREVRTAEQIRQHCTPVDLGAAEPGDLLFFEHTYEPNEPPGPDGHVASHVGISLGAGTRRMWDCHCADDSGLPGVGQTDISTGYWQSKLFQAGRPPGFGEGPVSHHSSVAGDDMAHYRVTADGVRLRAQPGTSQAIVVQNLGSGTTVTALSDQLVAADGHNWRNVRTAGGQVGWVAAEFLAVAGPDDPTNGELSNAPDHVFDFSALWPHIQAAAGQYGTDAQVVAAIMRQESGFKNWRVHMDHTGHGLFGLDDNGLLPDFEQWSGQSYGRGDNARSIPPKPQIEYCCKIIAAYSAQFGSAFNAARVWHRGPGLWQDDRGTNYEALIRQHIQSLFG
jgi:hypothetical protein